MLSTKKLFLILLAVLLTGAKSSEEPAKKSSEPIALPLTRVIDGDTFIAGKHKVRLWGIDAPEKNEEFFLASKLYLAVLLERAPFSCHFKHKDRYERYVMVCFSEGEDIGALMVREGLAKDYPKYSFGNYQEEEKFAKESVNGIWKKGAH